MEVYKYTKKTLRRKALDERGLCTKRFVSTKSLLISRKLVDFLKLKKIKNIVSYKPINKEANPNFFLFSKNFNVFFTKIHDDILLISKSNSFKKHKFSVLEPFRGIYIFKKQIDCFIVPGLVFDERGYRIGYGMGFYDKLLHNTKALKIGVGFDFQVKNSNIKEDEFDIPLDYIITEKRIKKCRR